MRALPVSKKRLINRIMDTYHWGKQREIEEVKADKRKTPGRDPETIKDINTLLKACHEDFKLQPKQVYDELNVSGPMEIADPVEAYKTIAAVRG